MAGFLNFTKEKLVNKVVEISIDEIIPNPISHVLILMTILPLLLSLLHRTVFSAAFCS